MFCLLTHGKENHLLDYLRVPLLHRERSFRTQEAVIVGFRFGIPRLSGLGVDHHMRRGNPVDLTRMKKPWLGRRLGLFRLGGMDRDPLSPAFGSDPDFNDLAVFGNVRQSLFGGPYRTILRSVDQLPKGNRTANPYAGHWGSSLHR